MNWNLFGHRLGRITMVDMYKDSLSVDCVTVKRRRDALSFPANLCLFLCPDLNEKEVLLNPFQMRMEGKEIETPDRKIALKKSSMVSLCSTDIRRLFSSLWTRSTAIWKRWEINYSTFFVDARWTRLFDRRSLTPWYLRVISLIDEDRYWNPRNWSTLAAMNFFRARSNPP